MAPCSTVPSPESLGFSAFVLSGLLLSLGWLGSQLWERTLETRAREIAWDGIQAAHQRAADRNAEALRRELSLAQTERGLGRGDPGAPQIAGPRKASECESRIMPLRPA